MTVTQIVSPPGTPGAREYLDSRGEKHDGVPAGWPMYAAAVTAQ